MAAPKLNKAAVKKALEQKLAVLKENIKQYDRVKAEVQKRQDKADMALCKAFAKCENVEDFRKLLYDTTSGNNYDYVTNKHHRTPRVEVDEDEKKVLSFNGKNPQYEIAQIEMALQEVDLFDGDTLPASGNLTYLQLIRR